MMKVSQAGIEPIENECPIITPGEEESLEPIEDFSRPEDYEDYSPCTDVLPVTGKFE